MKETIAYEAMEKEGFDLLEKAYATRVNDLEKSICLARQAMDISQQIHHPGLAAKAQNHLGLFHMILGKFEEANTFAHQALSYFEKAQNLKGIADAKYTIAGVHYKTDNFHVGLEYLLDCLFIYRKLNDHYNEARVLKATGTIYEYFGDQENAIQTYLQSVEAGQRAHDSDLESNAYNPLSGIYLKRGMYDLALSTIEKSIEIKKQTSDIRGLAFSLYGRGKVFIKLKKFDKALADLSKALELQIQMGDKLGIAMAHNKIGLLYYESKRYEEATVCLTNALEIANQYNLRFIRCKSLYNLYQVSRAEGRTDAALDYLERYMAIKDSITTGQTYSVIKSYESISKIKELERQAEVQRSNTEIIEKKNAELDSFFYRVSHDLKGPISSLIGLHNLVKHEIKDKEAQRYFGMYQSQIMRIENIVMDLINLTRMNHIALTPVKINFESLLDECINAYVYLDNYKSITFIKQIDSGIEFHSEWSIVNTIVQNLIENAIKYASVDKEPFVRVNISQCSRHVRIVVEDNGVGIDPDYKTKIFDMFFRANDRVKGTGLGLYILKRAVERLKGEVSFVSEVEVGSTFTILLPNH